MSIVAAIDSNALTYFVNALGVVGYDPASDDQTLAIERVAMARLFLYGDCRLWVPPVVRRETFDMPAGELQDAHHRATWYQLLDHNSGADERRLKQRAEELFQHHPEANDCRLVAETEGMALEVLITRDNRLQRRLQPHTAVRILFPSELWTSLGITCDRSRVWSPAPSNPLSTATWWKLPEC